MRYCSSPRPFYCYCVSNTMLVDGSATYIYALCITFYTILGVVMYFLLVWNELLLSYAISE